MSHPPSQSEPQPQPDWIAQLATPAPVIARRRDLTTVLLRAAAVVALCGSFIPLLSWLAEGISDGDLLDFWYYGGRVTSFVVLATLPWLLMLLAPRIARRIVPARPSPVCPGCGFDVSGLTRPLCPECALDLSPAPRPGTPPVGGLVWRASLIVVFRSIAVVLLVTGLGDLLSWLWWIVQEPTSVWYVFLGTAEMLQCLLVVFSSVGPPLMLWVLAPLLARLALRGVAAWPRAESDPPG